MTGEATRELATTRALDALPSGAWHEMCDVRCPARRVANLDHIVVGRSGIFVIDSRDWTGKLEVTPEALTEDGSARQGTITRAADSALALTEVMPGLDLKHVTPVLCFDRDEEISGRVGDVLVCTTANVVEVLTAQRRVWGAEEADQWFDRLKWTLPPGTFHLREVSGQPLSGHRRDGRARTGLAPRRSSARHAPSVPGSRMTPWVRAALVAIICWLVMIPSVAYGAWPGGLS